MCITNEFVRHFCTKVTWASIAKSVLQVDFCNKFSTSICLHTAKIEESIMLFYLLHITCTNKLYIKCYVRIAIYRFSSAFNTIQPHRLIPKLIQMNVSKSICLWILGFLIQRPQFVFINHKKINL